MSLIERRRFLIIAGAFLAFIAVTGGNTACAQQTPHGLRRIGFLSEKGDFAKRKKPSPLHQAFLQSLADAGFVDGKNLIIEYRFADGDRKRLPDLARELVALKPEVIFAYSSGAGAVAAATKTVPVVFVGITDPVVSGFVQSLAHPGGNVTGFSN